MIIFKKYIMKLNDIVSVNLYMEKGVFMSSDKLHLYLLDSVVIWSFFWDLILKQHRTNVAKQIQEPR